MKKSNAYINTSVSIFEVNTCCLDTFAAAPVQMSTPERPEVRRTLDLVEDDLLPSPIVQMQSESDTEKYATYSISIYVIT